jgi:hypothetical protein
VLHCHAGDAAADNIQLAEHLDAYHPADHADDWHLHVMLMSELVASNCDEKEGEPATEPPLVCSHSGNLTNPALVLSSATAEDFAEYATQLDCMASVLRQLPGVAGNSSLTLQLSARPLCAVLCVARC